MLLPITSVSCHMIGSRKVLITCTNVLTAQGIYWCGIKTQDLKNSRPLYCTVNSASKIFRHLRFQFTMECANLSEKGIFKNFYLDRYFMNGLSDLVILHLQLSPEWFRLSTLCKSVAEEVWCDSANTTCPVLWFLSLALTGKLVRQGHNQGRVFVTAIT